MRVRFSRHALEKMQKRDIKSPDVYDALRSPDESYEDVEHDVRIVIKKVNRKSVIVAFVEEGDVVKVITLYYTVKFDRLVRSKMVRGAWKKAK